MDENELDEEQIEFSRSYFLARELAATGKKSTRKVSDIDIVDEQELRAAYLNLETRHEEEIAALTSKYRSLYSQWLFDLSCGFNLLMHGFGSKKDLMEDFASKALSDTSVLVVNGYLQSINLRQMLIALAELLNDELNPRNKASSIAEKSSEDLLNFLNGVDSVDRSKDVCVGVVVHSIDGPALREPDAQRCLAQVAACLRVRMVASIDHVNAPLLWDKKMVHSQFNWVWHHVPTFSPYKVEGIFYPLILSQGGTRQTTKTAVIVLQSLTPNAQNVFKLLADNQVAHPDGEGMEFTDLYNACREKFLVSSHATLNAHLIEFKDHALVKTRKNPEGQECLYIPLPIDAIQNLLEIMDG